MGAWAEAGMGGRTAERFVEDGTRESLRRGLAMKRSSRRNCALLKSIRDHRQKLLVSSDETRDSSRPRCLVHDLEPLHPQANVRHVLPPLRHLFQRFQLQQAQLLERIHNLGEVGVPQRPSQDRR